MKFHVKSLQNISMAELMLPILSLGYIKDISYLVLLFVVENDRCSMVFL